MADGTKFTAMVAVPSGDESWKDEADAAWGEVATLNTEVAGKAASSHGAHLNPGGVDTVYLADEAVTEAKLDPAVVAQLGGGGSLSSLFVVYNSGWPTRPDVSETVRVSWVSDSDSAVTTGPPIDDGTNHASGNPTKAVAPDPANGVPGDVWMLHPDAA